MLFADFGDFLAQGTLMLMIILGFLIYAAKLFLESNGPVAKGVKKAAGRSIVEHIFRLFE